MSLDLMTQAYAHGRPGPGNRAGLAAVFKRYQLTEADAFGHRELNIGQDVYEVYGPKADEPSDAPLDCMISIRSGLDAGLFRFLFDLCTEAQMVLLLESDDAFDGAVVLCPASVDPSNLPDDEIFTHPLIWTVPEQAADRLTATFSAFDAYRTAATADVPPLSGIGNWLRRAWKK